MINNRLMNLGYMKKLQYLHFKTERDLGKMPSITRLFGYHNRRARLGGLIRIRAKEIFL